MTTRISKDPSLRNSEPLPFFLAARLIGLGCRREIMGGKKMGRSPRITNGWKKNSQLLRNEKENNLNHSSSFWGFHVSFRGCINGDGILWDVS